ncbi:hypothetical protein D3C86_1246840 [compost metagenome]
MHGNAGRPDGMTFRFQSTRWVDWQASGLQRRSILDNAISFTGLRKPHGLIFDKFGNGEAVVRFNEREVVERCAGKFQRAGPGAARAFEGQRIATAQCHDVVDMLAAPETDGAVECGCRFLVGQNDRGSAIRNQRAVGAAQRACDVGVLVRNRIAEIEAEILAHMGIGIDRAIGVVLCGNHRQLFRAVAITLKICLCDAAELTSKPAGNIGLLRTVTGGEQDFAHLCGRQRRHFFGADNECDAAAPGFDEIHGAVEGGRSC